MADPRTVATKRDRPGAERFNHAVPCALAAAACGLVSGTQAAITAFRPGIVIAAYECADTIGAVVKAACVYALPVLVVDDGSCDNTTAVARSAGAHVIRHAVNRGKGAALVTGMRALAARRFTHALTMDGDGQHVGGEIPALLDHASRIPTALVIGARRIGSQKVATVNLFGNRVANLAVRLAAGVPIADTQSGFRVYPLSMVLGLPICAERFEYESAVLILAARAGVPIEAVPVDVYYPPIAERRSHYRKVRDTFRIIRTIAPLLVRRRQRSNAGLSRHLKPYLSNLYETLRR